MKELTKWQSHIGFEVQSSNFRLGSNLAKQLLKRIVMIHKELKSRKELMDLCFLIVSSAGKHTRKRKKRCISNKRLQIGWEERKDIQARLPLLGLDLGQRFQRPLARRRLMVALPLVVLILKRKPWVLARDFLDLLLFVWHRAAFPALTTSPLRFWLLRPLVPLLRSNAMDRPENRQRNKTWTSLLVW